MRLKLLFLNCFCSPCQAINFFTSIDYPYIIDSVEGPRKDEILERIQSQSKEINKKSPHIKIEYYVKEHINIPTIHVKYIIYINNNSYEYFLNVKTKNRTLPWEVNMSFVKDLSFKIKKDIQAKLHFINNIKDNNNKSQG